ncbi:hypothetical protein CVU37_04290 [candidate division BRC1 bacterium HGW-BRC1-1]|jgi:hypothetical protein|nr:MAG: hypothetical protein CVU37_04290 [candidate division BRC1 bacterium HGW-BRC1-1]
MKTRSLLIATLAAGFIASVPAVLHAAPAQAPPAFGWPFVSPTYNITSTFDLDPATGIMADWTGWRTGEVTAGSAHAYDGHGGHDFGLPTGTNLLAPAAARVYSLRESVPNDDHSDTGNYLILDHKAATGTAVGGRDYRTRYWHLSQNGVVPGATGVAVAKGEVVAQSDNTGNSTGPHLHYGIALLPDDSQTCAFYHGWWENDEYYTIDGRPCLAYVDVGAGTLNCRVGTSTSYDIFTTLPPGGQFVATQRNGWWRVMLPLPPARVVEAREAGYADAGAWTDAASKSTVADAPNDANRVTLDGPGSRVSTFAGTGDPADVATFSFTAPDQRGLYDIYTTWPSDANAAGVTYGVTDSAGLHNVVVDQRGNFAAGPGTGTKADPFVIAQNPFVASHTTVGAPDEWAAYSPQGVGLPQEGPENLYRFELRKQATVTIAVEHSGYPTKDIDIHLLTSASPTACIQRADWSLTATDLAAGVYYIACDSYGTGAAGNAAATPYTLRVSFSEDQPFANSWVLLGSFTYAPGAAGSVQLSEATVTGPVDGARPSRVVADAIKIVPRITRRTGWISDGIATRINTASTPVASVVIRTDTTADGDSKTMDAYAEVPIYADPSATTANTSAIVGKAVTGQRFVCNGRSGDWYRVWLTNGTAATQGWLLGDHLIGYRTDQFSGVMDWSVY